MVDGADGAAIELPDLTKNGYTFDGWWTEPQGSEAGNGDIVTALPATFPAGTTKFYGHWTADAARIEFSVGLEGVEAPGAYNGVTDGDTGMTSWPMLTAPDGVEMRLRSAGTTAPPTRRPWWLPSPRTTRATSS